MVAATCAPGGRLPARAPGPGEVRLRVRRAGICGSDLHHDLHGHVGRFVPTRPFVLGREFAGEVEALGTGVPARLLCARVAVDPSIPCRACDLCRGGRPNLCPAMRFYGSASCEPHLDGGLSGTVLVPAANCHPIALPMTYA